ncbi:non-structural maintenance of chromosomes element 3 homolog [Limulus polyphemus]|uniref:Non-structural maintenance of chromosomes element 3 homolog n=1 Tax=Limulus polyphemus TaxID=6850 RepID=A0ABM1BYL9_LIMPO|nr:non-structural maintenance of chromosomes element 3 homolog [Limulus polyphemus]
MNLIELHSRPGLYLLLNDLDVKTEFSEHTLNWSEEENGKTGLLFFILSLIFMNGNVVLDNVMWTTLKRLGLDHEVGPHPLFGDIKKLVTQEFVRQQYMEYTRIPGSDPALYEFRWGPRAELELSKKELLEFVCYLYGNNMKPEQWTSQYQDVLRSEEQDEA